MSYYKAEYVWIDGSKPTPKLRSKGKVVLTGEEPPIWGFDGSSTNQAPGENSDCVLRPVLVCPDPIRGEPHKLVMCEVLLPDMTPHPSNTRAACEAVAGRFENLDTWFGIEQEYTFFQGARPLGFPENGFPAPQGGYYCGVGFDEVFGRDIVEDHMDACIKAELMIAGNQRRGYAGAMGVSDWPDRGARRRRSPLVGSLAALSHRREVRRQRNSGPQAGTGRLEWRRRAHQLFNQRNAGKLRRVYCGGRGAQYPARPAHRQLWASD